MSEEEHHATGETSTAPVRRIFSFQQLIILAVILVLSATGLVTVQDFSFTLLTLTYFFFLSKRILPPHKNPNRDAPLTSPPANKIFRLYVASAGVVGLLIPIIYIFQGLFLADDKPGVSAAAPHVFLLASQVLMEGVAAACGFSAPARILVPVVYNARRIMTLAEWITNEFSREYGGEGTVSVRRVYAGRVLAAVNLGIWSFNLFGVLIPVYLPRAFERYYGSSKEV